MSDIAGNQNTKLDGCVNRDQNDTAATTFSDVRIGPLFGNLLWERVKAFHPSHKGHCSREGTRMKHGSVPSLEVITDDDQLLGSGAESNRKGVELYEHLCNFREMLHSMGFESLVQVPVELVSLPLFHRQAHVQATKNLTLQRQTRTIPHGSDQSDADRNKPDHLDRVSDGVLESNGDRPSRVEHRLEADNFGGFGNDLQDATDLLHSIGFDESLVSGHLESYFFNCKEATYQCADFVRRLVSTQDTSTGNDSFSVTEPNGIGTPHQTVAGASKTIASSSVRVRALFRPVSERNTVSKYATNVSRLILFFVRVSILKVTIDSETRTTLKDDMLSSDTSGSHRSALERIFFDEYYAVATGSTEAKIPSPDQACAPLPGKSFSSLHRYLLCTYAFWQACSYIQDEVFRRTRLSSQSATGNSSTIFGRSTTLQSVARTSLCRSHGSLDR